MKILKCSLSSDADASEVSKAGSFNDGELKDKKCTICCQVFTTESQLQKHLREHEVNDKVRAKQKWWQSQPRQVSTVNSWSSF